MKEAGGDYCICMTGTTPEVKLLFTLERVEGLQERPPLGVEQR